MAIIVTLNVVLAAAALTPEEQRSIDTMLEYVTYAVVGLMIGLLILAVTIRQISRRTTLPCRWCMEFISRKASTCPKCGKVVPDAK
jgi:hypothetical protein